MQFHPQQDGKGQQHLYLLVGKVQHLAGRVQLEHLGTGTQFLSRFLETGENSNLVVVGGSLGLVQGKFSSKICLQLSPINIFFQILFRRLMSSCSYLMNDLSVNWSFKQ
jgi:hypothetical protein